LELKQHVTDAHKEQVLLLSNNAQKFLLLFKNVSSVVRVVVGAAISIETRGKEKK